LILAYVIMPDHLHVITDGENKPAVTHGFLMQVRFGLVDYEERLYLSHYLDG
jgi:REP element-mobilizing transposase RayT